MNKKGRPAKWPWRTIQVGEAFEMFDKKPDSARAIIATTNRRLAPLRFSMEVRDGEVHVVRVS